MKPGAATFPFFGIEPALLTEDGQEVEGPGKGYLVGDVDTVVACYSYLLITTTSVFSKAMPFHRGY